MGRENPTSAGWTALLSAGGLVGSVVIMDTRRWIAIGLAAAAAAAAATTVSTAAAAATTPTRHAYLQQDLQRDLNAITATGVPGVLAEVRTGVRQLSGTSGVADLDSRTPVNSRGFFRIGSNTKTFVSVVVLQLVAEHRLSLDDTVGRWLPGVVHGNGNDGDKITVRELLRHTSGLHNYTDDLQAQITSPEAYRKLEFHQFSRQDLLDIALAHQPASAPGAAFNYSNTNYVLLGMIIEKVTHDSWEDQVTHRIIVPLGLRHTFAPGTSTRLPRPHATGYLIFDKNTRVDTTAENMSWADSAGALISTAADLNKFWSAIGSGTLLPPAQIREMRQTVPATGGDAASVPGSRYGLGIFFIPLSCGGGYWSHEGDVPGYNTIGAVSSDGRTTVVLSINSNVDDPVLAAEYRLVDHVMCNHAH
jgi:D-alanyl-D-alanine carboxypeptidase